MVCGDGVGAGVGAWCVVLGWGHGDGVGGGSTEVNLQSHSFFPALGSEAKLCMFVVLNKSARSSSRRQYT